jgi:hypothetical protein
MDPQASTGPVDGALALVDLPAHVIACVVDQLPADDELAVALTCRELRAASAQSSRAVRGVQLTTHPRSLFSSLRKLQWGVACGAPLGHWLCKLAVWNGSFEQLSWLRSVGCPWNEDTCTAASGLGHPHILQWARAYGCPWDTEACAAAACYGRFSILAWLRENGCPWDAQTFEMAMAEADRPEMLEWLFQEKCPHDHMVFVRAAGNGFVR